MRRYRQAELSEPKHYSFAKWTMHEFGERSYTRSVIAHLIERIKRSSDESDPLTVVHDFICWMDTIRMNGNHPIKNEFVTNVIWIADNLEQYLWEAEKKKDDSQGGQRCCISIGPIFQGGQYR